jgi:hypothetical protein
MRARRSRYLVAAVLVAVFAYPVSAAAESTEPAEEGAVVHTLLPSQWPWGHWTEEEIEEAEPLPVVT